MKAAKSQLGDDTAREVKVRPVLSEAERRSRLLIAFPWAKNLSPQDLELFVREMADHPSDIPNNQLEALLVRWKAHALASTRRPQRLRHAA